MGGSGGLYPTVGGKRDVAPEEKHDATPWYLIATALAVLLTFFVVMPILGFMYMDMYNATNAAITEVRKMKELRRQILIERSLGD